MAYLTAGKITTIVNALRASYYKRSMTTVLTEVAAAIAADSGAAADMPAVKGVTEASKLVAVGANKHLDTLVFDVGGLKIGAGAGTAVTGTAAELNTLAGVTAGVASASKAAVLGTNKNLDEFHTAALYLGAGAGTLVTSTAAQINAMPVDKGVRAVNHLRVASAVVDAETVTIGADVYEVDTRDVAHITAGRIRLNLSAGSTVKSQGKLTIAEPVTAGDTIVIGTKTYTFVPKGTALSDGEIDLGDSEAHTKLNIVIALKGSVASPTWTGGTANPNSASEFVTCPAAFVGDDLVLTAIAGGTVGNLIATTEGLTHVNNVFDGVVLGTTTAGVDPTAGEFTTALLAAINGSGTEAVTAVRQSANEIYIYADADGAVVLGCTETLGGVNNAWAAAAMYGGVAGSQVQVAMVTRVPNAVEVALDHLFVPLPFTARSVLVDVRTTATGAKVAWNGGVVISAAGLLIDNGSTVDWSVAETLYIFAWA